MHGKLPQLINPVHPINSGRMSPENTHKRMGFYMAVLILGDMLQYMVSAPLIKLFSLGCMHG